MEMVVPQHAKLNLVGHVKERRIKQKVFAQQYVVMV